MPGRTSDEQIRRSAEAAREALAGDLATTETLGTSGGARDNTALDNYLKRIDPQVAASFTAPQRQALKTILGLRAPTRHTVEVRRSFGLGRKRYYLVFLLGRDRRALARLHRERTLSGPAAALRYLGVILLFLLPVVGLVYFG